MARNGTKKAPEEIVPVTATEDGNLVPARQEPLHRAVRFRVQTLGGQAIARLDRPCGHATELTLGAFADISFEVGYTLSQTPEGIVQLEEDCHICRSIAADGAR